MSRVTLATLKSIGRKFNPPLDVFEDEGSNCYRADAPEGFCFEPDLHGLVAPYSILSDDNPPTEWKRESREDLLERLNEYLQGGGLEECAMEGCEYCHPLTD